MDLRVIAAAGVVHNGCLHRDTVAGCTAYASPAEGGRPWRVRIRLLRGSEGEAETGIEPVYRALQALA
jgi:hypothetical protein